jgi:hypothetical protein
MVCQMKAAMNNYSILYNDKCTNINEINNIN